MTNWPGRESRASWRHGKVILNRPGPALTPEPGIEGVPDWNVDRLRKLWKLRPGDPYDAAYASEFLTGVVPQVVRRGGGRSKAEKSELVDDEAGTVDVTIRFR